MNIVGRIAGRIRDFIYRQKHNYRVGAARLSANKFLVGLTSQYGAIYTVGLGADSVQLGSLTIFPAVGRLDSRRELALCAST